MGSWCLFSLYFILLRGAAVTSSHTGLWLMTITPSTPQTVQHCGDCLSGLTGACRWQNALEDLLTETRQGSFKFILGARAATEQNETDA